MTIRRTLTLLSAMVMTTGAMTVAAPSASALNPVCNNTNGGPFDGTQVCIVVDELVESTITIPYSVGSTCVAGECTPTASGNIVIPWDVDEDPVESYGTICIPWLKGERRCTAFDTGGLY